MSSESLANLLRNLIALPGETEWLEFKKNNAEPQQIGENISAIANSAALCRQPSGYIVWGVDDASRAVVGTTFRPHRAKKGNEELENWLITQLKPRIDVRLREGDVEGRRVVIFEIQAATTAPVRFRGIDHVRIGSYTKKLADHPEKERKLWTLFDEMPFETTLAAMDASSDDVLSLIDYPEYFRLMSEVLPDNRAGILAKLKSEGIIRARSDGRYDITNLGGLLFARALPEFERLSRKALRVVIYRGDSRVETVKEQAGAEGYAVGFEGAVAYISDQLPQNNRSSGRFDVMCGCTRKSRFASWWPTR